MKYDEKIPMPTREEMNQSIDLILDKGLATESGTILWWKLTVRELLFGMEDCAVLAFLFYAAVMTMFAVMSARGVAIIPLLFLISPLLFAGMMYPAMWKDIMNRTIEWKQVCRINYKLITVYRMILFGGLSMVMNVGYNLLIWELIGKRVSFLWILSFSFTSLFLYGLISLILLNRNIPHGILILSGVWTVISLSMFLYKDIMQLAVRLPFIALLIVLGLLMLGIVCEIRLYMMSPRKGELINAYN